ncbi:hypothetical protein QAD02_003695 [Eretmocerus hayati]|uniref:Uncharacterized protein n=1 Tax=Eretmocerus hayati TaxID=131215 RepID=A0ACC2NNF4_9HYME|nr:hypothetical protein QAD02_003695 [Eretmocerus hayati]
MSSTCKACRQAFNNNLIATCVICNELYHGDPECAGITASEVKVLQLKNKPLLTFTCNDCKVAGRDKHFKLSEKLAEDMSIIRTQCDTIPDIKNQLNEVKEKVNSFKVVANEFPFLQAKVANLEEKLEVIQSSNSLSGLNEERMIHEVQERIAKSKNLLLHNVP